MPSGQKGSYGKPKTFDRMANNAHISSPSKSGSNIPTKNYNDIAAK